ncbi:monocarboxylate permease [Coprinopsis marcescibilis]|uniref:Monocarboxylate permease n=1 Tax=Coprinopsis marcescibilis TaxID=230819 RepID=A0A5C3KMB1_COPMA|nr:monocarboxylate permease [Coprinopsis marcescibilis]
MKSKRDSEANSDETLASGLGIVIETKTGDGADEEGLKPSASPEFPEGGLEAWLTVLGASLVQYTTFGWGLTPLVIHSPHLIDEPHRYINAFGVYQDFYVRHYLQTSTPSAIGYVFMRFFIGFLVARIRVPDNAPSASRKFSGEVLWLIRFQFRWIGGTQIFLNFSMGLFTGRLFDRGYFRHLMIASVLLHGIALFMLSLSNPGAYYQVFLTNGVALGAACGITYVPSLGIVSHYFHRRRSVAIGIVSSGSALGAIVHPIMLNRLFDSSVGFHTGVKISACINVIVLIIAGSIMRTRLPPKGVQSFPIVEWVKEPAYALILIAGLFSFLGLFFPVFYLQLNAITHGVDKKFAFYALSILNAASVFGRMIPNALAPKLGLFNLLVFFTTGTGAVALCMAAVKDAVGTALFAVFFGFFSGACIALVPATIGLLAKDMNEVGTRMGIFFGTGGILGLFATPIAGALLTSEYRWLNPTLFSGVSVYYHSQ